MRKSKSLSLVGIFSVCLLLVWSCTNLEEYTPNVDMVNSLDAIPEVLKSIENGIEDSGDINARKRAGATYATFNAALGSSGLASVFARNELTVFAPTDEAFAKLELNPGNIRRLPNLREILLYHVVAGTVLSTDLSNGFVPTLNGAAVEINLNSGAKVNNANIVMVDKRARNGVIHGIDEVLLPPTKNIVELAKDNDFSILLAAVEVAGFTELLSTTNNLTVFAPTNQAFLDALNEFGVGNLDELVDKIGGLPGLRRVLAYHVFGEGRVYSSDLSNTTIKMFSGDDLIIDVSGPKLIDFRNRESNIVSTDIQATNGVIHVINKVILPI
jgi:uncharacterized surface protein with fasciclin (FAS1) repeats